MASLLQRRERIRLRLGLTVDQMKSEQSFYGALERELKLWGTPFPVSTDEEPTSHGKTLFKVALVVGHRKDRDGVYAPAPLATGEWPFNSDIAELTALRFVNHPSVAVKVLYREKQPSGRYSDEIDDVYGRVDAWIGDNSGISAELHFNDLRTKESPVHGVGGKEVIYSGSTKGKIVARIFHNANPLPIKNRGLRVRSRKARGGRSVHAGKAPAVLLEPFDGRNPRNNKLAAELGVDGFADFLEEAILLCAQSTLLR